MSFILDALKRSEAERHRQAGPTLMDLRIAPRRRRVPVWIVVVAAVLLANLAVLTLILVRHPGPPAGREVLPAMVPPAAPAAPATPANVLPPPTLLPTPAEPAPEPATQAPAQVASTRAPAVLPAPAQPVPATQAPATSQEDALLPSAVDLRLAGVTVPDLQLVLHVYDARAANRYVLLNSRRLQEGDSTSEGVRLERVTPTGVVLSWHGQRFRLEAGQ